MLLECNKNTRQSCDRKPCALYSYVAIFRKAVKQKLQVIIGEYMQFLGIIFENKYFLSSPVVLNLKKCFQNTSTQS